MVNAKQPGTAGKRERAPYDWYREHPRAVEQLLARVDFGNDLIWDPCCGAGNVLDVAERWGHETVGSDIIDRQPRHRFIRGNILTQISSMPTRPGHETSIISNPPYGYEKDLAERIITHVLERYAVRKAAFILPIGFLCGQERWGPGRLARWKPSQVCIYRERHTMPPGHLIDQMAEPYAGGMADYVVLVFTRPHRWQTETIWLPVGHQVPRARAPQPRGENDAPQEDARRRA